MSIEQLKYLVESSNYLIDLDISYNELKPEAMMDLIDIIQYNRKLQYLNLSHNQLTSPSSMIDQIKMEEMDEWE